MTGHDDPYRELAAAIIKLAVTDYESAYKHYLRRPDSAYAKDNVERQKKFFYSDWFELLADQLDGPRLVHMVEEKVQREVKKE